MILALDINTCVCVCVCRALIRSRYVSFRKFVLSVQCLYRRWAARRRCAQIRREMHSLNTVSGPVIRMIVIIIRS